MKSRPCYQQGRFLYKVICLQYIENHKYYYADNFYFSDKFFAILSS
nr:MAG TPA: hypothetical protein [Caudoviricetes sp.]